MDNWLTVHSQAYTKVYLIYGVLFGLNLLGFIIFSIYSAKSNASLELLKENDPDIYCPGLKSFSFTEEPANLEYATGMSNLGTTGRLYLNCYTGKCRYMKNSTCTRRRCYTNRWNETICEDYTDYCINYTTYSEYKCSNQCRKSKSNSCGSSYCSPKYSSYKYYSSSCSNENDSKNISSPKSCNAENLILYWGNASGNKLYYRSVNNTDYKKISYLNNAVTANESCPVGKKMCGILDNLGNKLCYPEYLNCPLNYITTNKAAANYSDVGWVELKNKTVYFTNEATQNGKIIGGFFVDSDLLVKYKKEDCETLEEGTISNLLDSHPYKLYRNSIGYDPYTQKTDVVKNGKSYLKWCVPGVGKEKNIGAIKELKVRFDFNVSTNKEVVKPIKSAISTSYLVSLFGHIGLFTILIIIIFSFFEQNSINANMGGCCRCSSSVNLVLLLVYAASTLLIFVGTILACVNIGKISQGKNVDLGTNVLSSLFSLNIAIIFINFFLIIIIVLFCIYLFITPKYLPPQENVTHYNNFNDNNKNNFEFKEIKNNDSNYNSSNFNNNNYYNNNNYNNNYYNNNNYNNNYYNNSGYNNSLLPNHP